MYIPFSYFVAQMQESMPELEASRLLPLLSEMPREVLLADMDDGPTGSAVGISTTESHPSYTGQ